MERLDDLLVDAENPMVMILHSLGLGIPIGVPPLLLRLSVAHTAVSHLLRNPELAELVRVCCVIIIIIIYSYLFLFLFLFQLLLAKLVKGTPLT